MPRGCQDRRRDRQEMRETASLGGQVPRRYSQCAARGRMDRMRRLSRAMGRSGDGVRARCNGQGWLYDGQSLAVEGRRDLQGES